MIQKLLLTLLGITISYHCFAQGNFESKQALIENYKKEFKPKNQICFNISPNFYNSLQIKNTGADWLKSSPSFGGTFGVGFYQTAYKNIGITASANAGVLTYNMKYDFESKVQHPDLNSDVQYLKNTSALPYVNLNFGLVYQLKHSVTKYNYYPTISLGISRNILPTFSYSSGSSYFIDQQNLFVRIFDSEVTDYLNLYEPSFPVNSFYLKLGLLKQNKKNNTFSLNTVIQYAPSKIGKGQYNFSNLEEQSSGTLELGLNYVGLEFIYGLTLRKPK